MAPLELDFSSWLRSGLYSSVTSAAKTPEGRLRAQAAITLRNELPPHEAATGTVEFDILGPGDIEGLSPFAVRHMAPPPGTVDAEETKCAYVEFAEPDLPWRYTPEIAAGTVLRPWIALIVGTNDEVQLHSQRVTLLPSVLQKHPLAESARWAHVQDDSAHPGTGTVARLLCIRDLTAETDYIAVIVPTFTEIGADAWDTASPPIDLPAFAHWGFRTAAEGDFPTLAAQLSPALAGAELGRAPLEYTPLAAPPPLWVRGALARIGTADAPVPGDITDDLEALTASVDAGRRPIVGLPAYGDAWVPNPDATAWGAAFRVDPRSRGVAGLGLRSGIEEQDLLTDAAARQAGALDDAARRIRNLTAGLNAARSLWTRRLPDDPLDRLALFGPALGRMMTDQGSVLDRITAPGRPLPAALFSSAAARVLRSGPARTAAAADGASDAASVLIAANTCPVPPPKAPDGLPHADRLEQEFGLPPIDELIERALGGGQLGFDDLEQMVAEFDRSPYSDNTVAEFDRAMEFWIKQFHAGAPIPVLGLIEILQPNADKLRSDHDLLQLLRASWKPQELREGGLLDLLVQLQTYPVKRQCLPVDLGLVSDSVTAAINPTVPRPFVVDRVLGAIQGLDDQPLTPPELCPDLDIPAWQFLRDHDPNWLLPGAGTLPENGVIAMETNSAFVDAFLIGVNTQITAELRFRNIPMRSGCTPLRQFWARANLATGTYDDDILGVDNWPGNSPLGSSVHQTAAAASADLVIVFRTSLFRRYPHTLVYLAPAELAGEQPDWDGAVDFSRRLLPSFQGRITPDIVFFGFDLEPELGRLHWVVLEEPPHGYQFFSAVPPNSGWDAQRIERFHGTAPNSRHGGAFADAAFADPYRVMIRGTALVPVVM